MTSPRPELPRAGALDHFVCLALDFEVVADDPSVADELADLYAACVAPARSEHARSRLELRRTERGLSARLDDGPCSYAAGRDDLMVAAMALIDGATVDATAADLLLIHASAVMTRSGPVLLVGPSGAGKSTLAAALTRQGWPYAGDEVLGLDESATQLRANPKPLKLDQRSRIALSLGAEVAGETLVAPAGLGPCVDPGPCGAPVAVVRIAYVPDARAEVSAISKADVAETVADQCFNFARWGARGLDTVAALARRAPGLRIDFGDLEGAVTELDRALR